MIPTRNELLLKWFSDNKATLFVCGECGGMLLYDNGQEETRNEPGQNPSLFCTDCGLDFDAPDELVEIKNTFIS